SFRTNRVIFKRMNLLASLQTWRRSVDFWSRLSRFTLDPTIVKNYHDESLGRIVDVLSNGRDSPILHEYPNANTPLAYPNAGLRPRAAPASSRDAPRRHGRGSRPPRGGCRPRAVASPPHKGFLIGPRSTRVMRKCASFSHFARPRGKRRISSSRSNLRRLQAP